MLEMIQIVTISNDKMTLIFPNPIQLIIEVNIGSILHFILRIILLLHHYLLSKML